jgi:hypothetical protein
MGQKVSSIESVLGAAAALVLMLVDGVVVVVEVLAR